MKFTFKITIDSLKKKHCPFVCMFHLRKEQEIKDKSYNAFLVLFHLYQLFKNAHFFLSIMFYIFIQFRNLLFNYEVFWMHYSWKSYKIFTAYVNKKVESSYSYTEYMQNHQHYRQQKPWKLKFSCKVPCRITEYLLKMRK